MPNFNRGSGRAWQGHDYVVRDSDLGLKENGIHASSVALPGSSYVFESEPKLLGMGNAWTINFFAYNNDFNTDQNMVLIKEPGSNANRIEINNEYLTGGLGFQLFGGVQMDLYDENGTKFHSFYSYGSPYSSGWHMWTFTWDGTDSATYINGYLNTNWFAITDNPGVMVDSSRVVKVGSSEGTYSDGWNGSMHNMMVFNKVLTHDELTDLHNHSFPGEKDYTKDWSSTNRNMNYTSSSNLVHYYRFGDDANKVGRDFAITGYTAHLDSGKNTISSADLVQDSPEGSGLLNEGDGVNWGTRSEAGFAAIADTWTMAFRYMDRCNTGVDVLLQFAAPSTDVSSFSISRENNPPVIFVISLFDTIGALKVHRFNLSNYQLMAINNTYHYFVWTHTSSSDTFYWDGYEVTPDSPGSNGIFGSRADRIVCIGQNKAGSLGACMQSSELVFWDKVLSAPEVLTCFNNGRVNFDYKANSGNYASADDVVLWWELGAIPKTTDPAVIATTTKQVISVKVGTEDPYVAGGAGPGLADIGGLSALVTPGQGQSIKMVDESFRTVDDIEQSLGISDTWSISAWARPTLGEASSSTIFNVGPVASGDTNNVILLACADDAAGGNDPLYVQLYNADGSNGQFLYFVHPTDGVGFTTNQFRHVLVTWNGFAQRLTAYLDGIVAITDTDETDTTNICNQSDSGRIVCLGEDRNDSLIFNGYMGSVSVWSNELSITEVRQVYAKGNNFNPMYNVLGYRSAHNLRHWWPLQDISGTGASIGNDQVSYKNFQHHLESAQDITDYGRRAYGVSVGR